MSSRAVLNQMAFLFACVASFCVASAQEKKAIAPELDWAAAGADPEQDSVLIVHYRRPDGNYADWNLWVWPEGGQGGPRQFTGRDDYGVYAVLPVDGKPDRVGFIVRRGDWLERDLDFDRFANIGDDGVAEIWLSAGDPAVYGLNDEVDMTVRITGAFLDARDTITLTSTGVFETSGEITVSTPSGTYEVAETRRSDRVAPGRSVVDVVLAEPVSDADIAQLTISVPGENPEIVYARDVLTEPAFTALDAELGPIYSAASTTFTTWSPVASKVELLLEGRSPVALARGSNGVWTTTISGDLDGAAYRYAYTSYGKRRVVPDVHAFAAKLDGSASIVVDLDKTDPEGFAGLQPPARPQVTDEIIYEIHVRDFTIADMTVPPSERGTYLGMIRRNPAVGGRVSSALDHLLDLGVTAVHLLPTHDYPGSRDEFNWGYWTSFFNVPEGNYATPGTEGAGVITEYKQAVQGLKNAGVRVILDVVYNHTSSSYEYSPFFQAVPYYYFRTYADGRLRNDAGVGNTMADERPMVRKYIVDSCAYWVSEYKIDGFRFDLMGCHLPETMAAVEERIFEIRSDLTVYGEPWTGGGPIYFNKGTQRGSRIGVFNDNIRNAIRGDLDGDALGFAVGEGGDAEGLKRGLLGSIDEFADHPAESITYVSAHDNRTLWDKIEYTLPEATDADKRAMQKLGLGAVLTSQGVAFLHGGSDFARTKLGNHNSYNSGDDINLFDWVRKAEYIDVFNYTSGLIQIRKQHPAFRMATRDKVRSAVKFLPARDLVVKHIDGSVAGDDWDRILCIYNGNGREAAFTLPDGEWNVVVDAETAGIETLRVVGGRVSVPGWSLMVLHRAE